MGDIVSAIASAYHAVADIVTSIWWTAWTMPWWQFLGIIGMYLVLDAVFPMRRRSNK